MAVDLVKSTLTCLRLHKDCERTIKTETPFNNYKTLFSQHIGNTVFPRIRSKGPRHTSYSRLLIKTWKYLCLWITLIKNFHVVQRQHMCYVFPFVYELKSQYEEVDYNTSDVVKGYLIVHLFLPENLHKTRNLKSNKHLFI